MAREHISLALRFTVLRRDHFSCMYCGARPPETRLHVDHYVAVANGGTNAARNLITACAECNLGKSDIDVVDHRIPGYRYESIERCDCPRPTCGGPYGRDASERDCECLGCHGCDLCGLQRCERIQFSSLELAHAKFNGCFTVDAVDRVLSEYQATDDPDNDRLLRIFAKLKPLFRDDVGPAVLGHAAAKAGLGSATEPSH